MPPKRKPTAVGKKEKVSNKTISKENKKANQTTVASKRNAKLSSAIPELVTQKLSSNVETTSKYIVSIEACK
ncbi:hypothetical protein Bhyg_12646, partial [Pseudolycoriella hygida]